MEEDGSKKKTLVLLCTKIIYFFTWVCFSFNHDKNSPTHNDAESMKLKNASDCLTYSFDANSPFDRPCRAPKKSSASFGPVLPNLYLIGGSLRSGLSNKCNKGVNIFHAASNSSLRTNAELLLRNTSNINLVYASGICFDALGNLSLYSKSMLLTMGSLAKPGDFTFSFIVNASPGCILITNSFFLDVDC